MSDSVAVASPGKIRVLPGPVAERIAAGEVVERPASVVKELIENAIDAEARQVSIELTEGGLGSIVVVDDGMGMGPEDAVVAFRRHATSKITSANDLFRITTLGFRGEALAAISAVADVRAVTRAREAEIGTEVRIHGGTLVEVRECGAAVGTRLEVRDLFFNTPARRKFLKAPGTEVGHVTELVIRFALAYPEIGFVLRQSGRTLQEFASVRQNEERLAQVLGRERAASMRPVGSRGTVGHIRGWISHPHVNFPTARHVYTYVNGRFVKDRLVSHALYAGYSTLLMHGRSPAAVLFLHVPPEEVDVNVHPAKAEVRFRRSGLVHELITRSVGEALRAAGPIQGDAAAPPPAQSLGSAAVPRLPFGAGAPPLRILPMPPAAHVNRAPEPYPMPAAKATHEVGRLEIAAAGGGFFSSLRVVGQVFDGYIVCQSPEAMILIDQHAAHERVVFEALRRAYAAGEMRRQALLVPAVLELRPREAAVLEEVCREFDRIGFEIEPFGPNTFAVRAVPALLADANPATLVRDLVEELAEVGSSRRLTDAAEDVLARLACHSVVRVGQALGAEQIRALLAAMDGVDFAGNCPHGRPAFLTFPRGELERRFRRS